jgi:ABC-2 type transport system ATP-binding protein
VPAVISIRGLWKSFESVHAVRGVDLEVGAGEILLLLGQNGAGKSTTLRCAGGILRPDAGEIRFGKLALPAGAAEIRRRLGVVPDLARLYHRNTAREYLDHFGDVYGLPVAARRRRIEELLERFDLVAAAERPLGTYSRGMAQKVALIRATLHDPEWIFCDEPTVGLDPVAAADMRRYLLEQRDRGAAIIVTTHVLAEAEPLADRVTIMRAGRIVASGSLSALRREAQPERTFVARLAGGGEVSYSVAWEAGEQELGRRAAELQAELAGAGTPYVELREVPASLEVVYLKAMSRPLGDGREAPPPAQVPGLRPSSLLGALAGQPRRLRQWLPFYLAGWWRRGELGWVAWLNGFVLLIVAGTAVFGSAPGPAAALAARIPRGDGLQAALLLPLFFMSFALLESIKTSIGVWWEKAQGSLEVLLYAPLADADLVWLEVLPGAVVSVAWVTLWMAAGLGFMAAFGRPAPWALLPVFALVAAATAYWAAMGRLLGFMLFPREGAAGGAWSFLLSPVSAAVADIPLALFVFGSPLAPLSLLLPLAACLVLTLITGATFDRERLLETGVGRERRRRVWLPRRELRRNLAALVAGLLLAAVPAGIGVATAETAGWHSWPQVAAAHAAAPGQPEETAHAAAAPSAPAAGVVVAAALLAGVVGAGALLLLLLATTFAAFFLLGLPELLALVGLAALWGVQVGFGPSGPLQGWLGLAGGVALLALAFNTAAGLPVYRALVFGAGSRIDRLRAAWTDYFALYRALVIPAGVAFGVVVAALLLSG